MAQRIIDLDEVLPENTLVRLNGEEYFLPADIPIPTFRKIERLVEKVDDRENLADTAPALEELYQEILELFRELNELPRQEAEGEDEGEEYLPIGARRMGALIVQLYAGDIEPEGRSRPPKPRGGTRNTKKTPKRSRS